jgi:hypothetical protein
MSETAGTRGDQVRVVSAIPGRLRFRLPSDQRTAETMTEISTAFGASEVIDVQTSLQTGSVLVRYDPETVGFDELQGVFGNLGFTLVFDRELPVPVEAAPAARVVDAAERLNARVARATKGVDLRLLVPLGLGALSARQALNDAPGLRKAPWYILAWYAFDSFLKLNPGGRRDSAVRRPELAAGPLDAPGSTDDVHGSTDERTG